MKAVKRSTTVLLCLLMSALFILGSSGLVVSAAARDGELSIADETDFIIDALELEIFNPDDLIELERRNPDFQWDRPGYADEFCEEFYALAQQMGHMMEEHIIEYVPPEMWFDPQLDPPLDLQMNSQVREGDDFQVSYIFDPNAMPVPSPVDGDYFEVQSSMPAATFVYRGNGHTGGSVPWQHATALPGRIFIAGPGTMTRSGHTFGGWLNNGNLFQPGWSWEMGLANAGRYYFDAHWIPSGNVVTIQFMGNGHTHGSVPHNRSFYTPGGVPLPDRGAMARTGHVFTGWRDGGGHVWSVGSTPNFSAGSRGTWTVWANWVPNQVNIMFSGNGHTGGNRPSDRIINTPGSAVVPNQNTMTRSGFSFVTWRDMLTSVDWAPNSVRHWSNITSTNWFLSAQWRLNPPTLQNLNNNQVLPRQTRTFSWTSVPAAGISYTFAMRNLTTGLVIIPERSQSGTSFTVQQNQFVPGHRYRVAVSARTGNFVSWSEREFTISDAVQCHPLRDIRRGTAQQYRNMNIGWPLGSAARNESRHLRNISSWFGTRSGTFHLGIDITDPAGPGRIHGTPILAVADGVVIDRTLDRNSGQGYHISFRSNLRDPVTGHNLIFTHMHMRDTPTLRINDTVRRGDVIGRVGNTGNVTSSGHLHFEVSNSGTTWGPDGNAGTDVRRRWYRVQYRVNPRFFYPADAFIGATDIWPENRGARP